MSRRFKIKGQTKSLSFNGTTSYVDLGADFIGTGDITYIEVMKPLNIGEGNAGRCIDNGKFIIYQNAANTIKLVSDSTTAASSADYALKYGSWNTVAITRTSTGVVNFRINGVANGTADQSSGNPVAGSTNVFLGNSSANIRTFNGSKKLVLIFNRILTAEEIDNIMYDYIMPSDYATSCTLHLDFENDTATTVYSVHNRAVTGTISNCTFTQDIPPYYGVLDYPGRNLFVNKLDGSAGVFPVGSAARTGAGWIEDERLGVYLAGDASSTYTGGFISSSILEITGVNSTGDAFARGGRIMEIIPLSSTSSSTTSAELLNRGKRVKPNTTYTLSVPIYFDDDIVTSGTGKYIKIALKEYGVDAGTLAAAATILILDNTYKNAWHTYTLTVTTSRKTRYLSYEVSPKVQGSAIITSTLRVNLASLTLTEAITPRTTATNRVKALIRY